MAKQSIAKRCLAFATLFEAELLTELVLRYWSHPYAEVSSFRNDLLEAAVDVLKASSRGEQLMEDLKPQDMNFVAALWYAEWNSVTAGVDEKLKERRKWLETVRRSVPSCFVEKDRL